MFGAYGRVRGFPGGAGGKESTCQGRTRQRRKVDPYDRKVLWSRKWQPAPGFLPGKFQGQRSLVVYSSWGHKESDTTERTQTHTDTHTDTHTQTHTHTHTHGRGKGPSLGSSSKTPAAFLTLTVIIIFFSLNASLPQRTECFFFNIMIIIKGKQAMNDMDPENITEKNFSKASL